MALLSGCACLDILSIIVAITVVFIAYFKWLFKYWEREGIPSAPTSIPFGTLQSPFASKKISFGQRMEEVYADFKRSGHKHVGVYILGVPMYLPIDTTYLKNIITKDFNHFVDRGVYYNEKDDPLSAHLFSIEGLKWKNLRAKLTPTFTSGKMKMMFHTLVECGDQMREAVDGTFAKGEPLDVKDVLSRFTIDVIGSCAFGLDCNSFKQPKSDFRCYGCKVLRSNQISMIKNLIAFACPSLARKLHITITPSDAAKFFLGVIRETVEYREQNHVNRNDFMQLLISLKNDVIVDEGDGEAYKHDGKSLTFEELAAQAFVFFIAGFDTSSTALTFCMFELAQNQEIQERMRAEICDVLARHDGKLTYEGLAEMKYMSQVLDESLRKYPPIQMLFRMCTKEYTLPDASYTIKQGQSVVISTMGLHHDPEHFPDPDKFDPDRFSADGKSKVKPFTFLPFGEGPRGCIGLRFGMMQVKVGLATLLKNYKFTLNEGTRLPLEYEPFSLVLTASHEILLNVEKVEEVSDWL